MFSGGLGQIDHRHVEKYEGEEGMSCVKIGGPAYRIGLGGGAASSKVLCALKSKGPKDESTEIMLIIEFPLNRRMAKGQAEKTWTLTQFSGVMQKWPKS